MDGINYKNINYIMDSGPGESNVLGQDSIFIFTYTDCIVLHFNNLLGICLLCQFCS